MCLHRHLSLLVAFHKGNINWFFCQIWNLFLKAPLLILFSDFLWWRFKGGFRSRPRGLQPPLFLWKNVLFFYRILRKIKSIYIANKGKSVPATPFWIFWIRLWGFIILYSTIMRRECVWGEICTVNGIFSALCFLLKFSREKQNKQTKTLRHYM